MASREGPAARPEVQGKLRQREKDLRMMREARIKRLMQTVDFRAFIYDHIFIVCNVMGQSDTGNSRTFFNEGVRNVGIMTVNELQRVAPQEYLAMISERLVAQRTEEDVKLAVASTAETEE